LYWLLGSRPGLLGKKLYHFQTYEKEEMLAWLSQPIRVYIFISKQFEFHDSGFVKNATNGTRGA